MKRKRFTEEQIIAVLREHEAGVKTGGLARKHGRTKRADFIVNDDFKFSNRMHEARHWNRYSVGSFTGRHHA